MQGRGVAGSRLVRGVAAAGAATALLLAFPLRADAHARITAVLPAPSSTVPGPLRQVLLKYNERVDQSFFRLTVDAHPVQGQFYFGVRTPATQASLQSDITHVSSRVGSFESGAGATALTGVIEAGRSVEIALLYLVLGTVLTGALVLRPRLVLAGAGGSPANRRACQVLLRAGIVSAVLVPLLFWLYAGRLAELIPGVGLSRILFSSIGVQWAVKTVLWLGLVGLVATLLRRRAQGRRQDRRPLFVLVALVIALAGAFVAGTHVGTGSVGPGWVYVPMMAAHIVLTAFWAGGLLAILLVVFPSRDPVQIWAAVTRFSRIMTVTAAILVAVGVLLLGRLLANFNALWCTGYGLIAGGVLVLAAVLGETQLPPLFNGRALPGEAAQSILGVTPSILGSGCQ
jgi:putative copper export protein